MQKLPWKYFPDMLPDIFLDVVSSNVNWRQKAMARLSVFEDTVGLVCSGEYTTDSGREVKLTSLDDMCSGTRMCTNKMDREEPKVRFDTVFEVVGRDCLDEARRLHDEGFNPALLNLANGELPCAGSVAFQTQEETLFRRTTLFLSLYQYWKRYRNLSDFLQATDFDIPQRDNQYPLSSYGAIYSPSVTVFRGKDEEGYAFLENPFDISVITSAAIQNPDTVGRRLCPEDRETTKEKIRTILRMGIHFGHDSLVLGAYGCGAFHNPPMDIARVFHEVFDELEFKGAFRRVSFAILDDSFCGREWNPEGNFLPFKREFSK